MNWFKIHQDSIAVIVVIVSAMWFMTSEIRTLENNMNQRFSQIDCRFSLLEKDMAIIKTVLIMKEIMPRELACKEE